MTPSQPQKLIVLCVAIFLIIPRTQVSVWGYSPQIMLVLGGSSIEGEIFLLSTMKIPCGVGRKKQRSEYWHLLEMYLKECGNFEVLSCVCVLRVRENLG